MSKNRASDRTKPPTRSQTRPLNSCRSHSRHLTCDDLPVRLPSPISETARAIALATLLTTSLAASALAQTSPAAPKSATDTQSYRNAEFGFHFQIPYGWVDRTKEMRTQPPVVDAEAKPQTPDPKAKPEAAKGDVLLAIFEHPPEATSNSVNSAVVIAHEPAASYPGLKKAEDYLAPLTELTTAQGFQSEGDPSVATIDARDLVRADFMKALTEKIAMYQSTLVMVVKGQILSFTFIAGSEDEVDELIEKLRFASGRAK
jgi:hypothetical protein